MVMKTGSVARSDQDAPYVAKAMVTGIAIKGSSSIRTKMAVATGFRIAGEAECDDREMQVSCAPRQTRMMGTAARPQVSMAFVKHGYRNHCLSYRRLFKGVKPTNNANKAAYKGGDMKPWMRRAKRTTHDLSDCGSCCWSGRLGNVDKRRVFSASWWGFEISSGSSG